jgi:hypothetical protein
MSAALRWSTTVGQLCAELGITSQARYRHVDPTFAE